MVRSCRSEWARRNTGLVVPPHRLVAQGRIWAWQPVPGRRACGQSLHAPACSGLAHHIVHELPAQGHKELVQGYRAQAQERKGLVGVHRGQAQGRSEQAQGRSELAQGRSELAQGRSELAQGRKGQVGVHREKAQGRSEQAQGRTGKGGAHREKAQGRSEQGRALGFRTYAVTTTGTEGLKKIHFIKKIKKIP